MLFFLISGTVVWQSQKKQKWSFRLHLEPRIFASENGALTSVLQGGLSKYL